MIFVLTRPNRLEGIPYRFMHSAKRFGRVRLQRTDGVSAAHSSTYVQASIETGATVQTDG